MGRWAPCPLSLSLGGLCDCFDRWNVVEVTVMTLCRVLGPGLERRVASTSSLVEHLLLNQVTVLRGSQRSSVKKNRAPGPASGRAPVAPACQPCAPVILEADPLRPGELPQLTLLLKPAQI